MFDLRIKSNEGRESNNGPAKEPSSSAGDVMTRVSQDPEKSSFKMPLEISSDQRNQKQGQKLTIISAINDTTM